MYYLWWLDTGRLDDGWGILCNDVWEVDLKLRVGTGV